jgi:thiosulfate/3-mercaptopyruvate sulfurtransferase
VLAAIDDPGSVIWDARSEAEYLGLRSGSRRAGHVPGAVNLDWVELMDPPRQLRLIERLPALLAAHGITPDKQVITHCQSHHRSGLTYLAARLLGYPRVRAYHGSWSEWGNRDDTPVETQR